MSSNTDRADYQQEVLPGIAADDVMKDDREVVIRFLSPRSPFFAIVLYCKEPLVDEIQLRTEYMRYHISDGRIGSSLQL